MTKLPNILTLFLTLSGVALLVSCRDFFYSDIKYNGSEEDCHLIVNAVFTPDSVPHVYVNRSFFVLNEEQYNESRRFNGALSDAHVEYQTEGQQPVSLSLSASNAGEYVAPVSFRAEAGDTVVLHVSHPVFGEAWGRQRMPAKLQMRVEDISLNEYQQLLFDVVFEPYTGADDEVIAVSFNSFMISGYKIRGNGRASSDITDLRSSSQTLYSLDPVFGLLGNRQSAAGYYGGKMLYIQGKELREEKRIACLLEPHIYRSKENISITHIDSLSVSFTAQSVSFDVYQYQQSLLATTAEPSSISDPVSVKSSPEDVDIYALIEELFDELGSLEGVLLYGNLTSVKEPKSNSSDGHRPFGLFGLAAQPCEVQYKYNNN